MQNNQPEHSEVRSSSETPAHSWLASLQLAFLASAGLYYINIFPAITDSLMEGAGLTSTQAGDVTSANALGAAFGALIITLLITRIPQWKKVAFGLLIGLVSIDWLTVNLDSTEFLVIIRFCHGLVGGALVGLGFSVIARTKKPSIAFSLLLVVQYGGGALGLWLLPPLVPEFGAFVPFYALIAFSLITLSMLPFIGAYPLPPKAVKKVTTRIKVKPLLLTLFGLFLFQAANMALFAFIFGMGKFFGHKIEFLSPAIASANIIAILGAVIAIYTGAKMKLVTPFMLSLLVAVVGTWLLIFSESEAVYFWVNAILGIAWAFAIPYYLTMAAKFDKAGQMAALGGFASKMGLATGPWVAGILLSDSNDYIRLINIAVVVLLLCLVVSYFPAKEIDRHEASN